MSEPRRLHTTSEPIDYHPPVPVSSRPATTATSNNTSRATTRRRLVSRGHLSAARWRSRQSGSWLSNPSNNTHGHGSGTDGPFQALVNHPSSTDQDAHPIGDSELLRLPTTGSHYREESSAPVSPSIPFSSASGRASQAVDQLLQTVGRESPGTSMQSRDSPELNLNEASDRLQQANTDLRLLLEQPFASEPLQRSSSETTRTHTLPTGRQEALSRRRFWYGLARPALSESSRTWDLHGRRRANFTASPAAESSEEEGAVQGPRKRQKLHDEATSTGRRHSQYGWYGQVVPAKLDLRLVSSDGGIVDCPLTDAATTSYGAENVLKDDSSVYCTKASRCNILLQHRHESLFSLDSLVIKAPRIGFTDPVHEGLVFVAMRNDRVLEWTAKYPICYLPTSLFAPYFPSLADSTNLTASEVELAREPSSILTSPNHGNKPQQLNSSNTDRSPDQILDTNNRRVGDLRAENISATNSTLRVEPSNSRHVLEARLQALARETRRLELIRNRVGPDWHPEEAEELTRLTMHISNRIREIGQAIANDNISRPAGTTASNTNPVAPTHAATHSALQSSRSAAVSPAPHNPLRLKSSFEHVSPVARFRMHQQPELDPDSFRSDQSYLDSLGSSDTNSITIKFDPPLSARYILLKLWSPRHGGNIDIQNISAQGYVGPRFFPAVEKR